MGIVRFALKFPYTFTCCRRSSCFSASPRSYRCDRHLSGNQHPGRHDRLAIHRTEHSGNGAAGHDLQPVRPVIERLRHPRYRSTNAEWHLVQKVFFQPDVNLDLAISQIVSATNFIRVVMPPGIQAPVVVQYNASSVPVLQIGLSSDTLNEQQLYDYGIYRLRQQLSPIHGITLPTPAGGKYRQIMVDLDPLKLQAKGLTPNDVVNAVNVQNLTLPPARPRSAIPSSRSAPTRCRPRSTISTTSRSNTPMCHCVRQGRRPGP